MKDYDNEIVGTMCHELSHIVHSNHSADFYKLMDELQGQFEKLRGSVGTNSQFAFAGTGHKADSSRHNPQNPLMARRLAAEAAEARCRKSKLMGTSEGHRLGGGNSDESWRRISPREAAARAAERRLMDDFWCPSSSVVDCSADTEISSSSSSPSANHHRLKPAGPKHDRENGFTGNNEVLELTSEDFVEAPFKKRAVTETNERSPLNSEALWECGSCTLLNPEITLACGACAKERPSD